MLEENAIVSDLNATEASRDWHRIERPYLAFFPAYVKTTAARRGYHPMHDGYGNRANKMIFLFQSFKGTPWMLSHWKALKISGIKTVPKKKTLWKHSEQVLYRYVTGPCANRRKAYMSLQLP